MLESLLNQPFFSSLALTLLHFIWQGVFIGALLWLVLSIVGKDKANFRYGISALAMIANFCSPIITFIIVSKASALNLPTFQEIAVNTLAQAMPVLAKSELAFNASQYLPYISVVYLGCVLLLALRLSWQTQQANQLKVSGVKPADRALQLKFSQYAAQLGLKKTPPLLISLKAQTPMVVGWLKPVVLMPATMISGLSAAQLEMLLLHELAHIRRHDYLINILQALVEMLLFYHPSVRWVSKQMRQEREYCSDDIALHHCANPVAYAHTLTDTAALCRRHNVPQMAMAASGGDLKLRVLRIVEHHCSSDHTKESYLQGLAPLMVISALVLASMTKFYHASGLDFILSSTPLLNKFELSPTEAQPIKQHTLAQQLLANKLNATKAQAEAEVHQGTYLAHSAIASASLSAFDNSEVVEAAPAEVANALATIEKVSATQSGQLFSAKNESDKILAELKQSQLIEVKTQREKQPSSTALLELPSVSQPAQDKEQQYEPVLEQVLTETFAQPKYPEQSVNNDNHPEANTLVLEPVIIESYQPHYPKIAKRKRIETEVKVLFTIDKQGRVTDITFPDQFGVGVFKQSIRNAMKKWRYQPAERNGQPVESQMTKIFDFNLVT
jgi:TonB family protein